MAVDYLQGGNHWMGQVLVDAMAGLSLLGNAISDIFDLFTYPTVRTYCFHESVECFFEYLLYFCA